MSLNITIMIEGIEDTSESSEENNNVIEENNNETIEMSDDDETIYSSVDSDDNDEENNINNDDDENNNNDDDDENNNNDENNINDDDNDDDDDENNDNYENENNNEIGNGLGLNDNLDINNILTSFIETVQTQMINISNADMAIINTNATNSANACMNVICVELIDGELFSRINSILMTTNTMYGFIHVYMENQNREFYTFEDSLKYLYTYMLFCRDDRMDEFKDTLLQYLTRYFKDVEMSRLIASRMQHLNEDVKVVLTESEFNKIEKITLKDVKINNDCGICLCPYEESDEIIKLKCNHCYHVECIKTQLCSYSSKCPMCKAEVEGEKQII